MTVRSTSRSPRERIVIRRTERKDIDDCGRIMFEAFSTVAERHGFPADVPSAEFGIALARFVINHPLFFGLAAEKNHKLVASAFLDERDSVRSVLVITVDPRLQGIGVGRRLMEGLLERAKGSAIRLVQDPHNPAALSLYVSLGFDAKELLALMTGRPKDHPDKHVSVRPLRRADVDSCAVLCKRVCGAERTNELMDAIKFYSPHVAERNGRIVAYATDLTTWQVSHGVAETDNDFRALLLGMSETISGPISFLMPTRQSNLFRWCLEQGLKVAKPMTLMAIGRYRFPHNAFFPSVAY